MQAKTLSWTWAAVVGLVGISLASEPGQSIRSVGFIRVTIPVGFSLIANPLQASDNSVAALFPEVPDGATIYKYAGNPPLFSINTYERGWAQPQETLNPGEGAFFFNPGPEPLVITFFGELLQGVLANPIPQGLSLRSSMVPIAGPIDTTLGFPVEDGDTVYRFRRTPNPNGYSIHTYGWGQWDTRPYIEIGEAFFVNKIAPVVWVKTFSITE
jgi:hypothetical protein